MPIPIEVQTRRNLPHWFAPGAYHFVTFRLIGSLPQAVLERLWDQHQREKTTLGDTILLAGQRDRLGKKYFGEFDFELDRCCEPAWLRQAAAAAQVRQSLYFLHDKHYYLSSYCIMPNHVHALFRPLEDQKPLGDATVELERPVKLSRLAKTMHSLKSYTAHRINRLLKRFGPFWQDESFDHWLRDEDELQRIVDYIAYNPVKAGLVQKPHEWFWSSAHDRFLQDGSSFAWLDWPT